MSNPVKMHPVTKTLLSILLVSVPSCLLVFTLASRTQASLPANARFEDSTSGLVLLTFFGCASLVILLSLRGHARSRRRRPEVPTLESESPRDMDFEARLQAFASSTDSSGGGGS